MARYTNTTFKIEWPEMIAARAGKPAEPIMSALASEDFFLAYAGNSADGWCIYLVDAACPHKKQQISPLFCKDFGDTRRDMFAACRRAYGDHNSPVVNLGREHPEECFRWMTY